MAFAPDGSASSQMTNAVLERLVAAARGGDLQAFATLVERFHAFALTEARRRLGDAPVIEDVVQEAFMAAYTDLRANKLRNPSAFSGWLRTIVRHQCSRVRRRYGPDGGTLGQLAAMPPLPAEAPLLLERREVRAQVRRAIALLPSKHRTVVRLYYLNETPAREIAASLELPLTTVKKRLVDGRRKIKERLLMEIQEGIERRTTLRRPRAEDWTSILAAANAALPGGQNQNEEWLEQRRGFDERRFLRRHYVAEDARSSEVIAYGAIECASEPGRFRLFLVMDPALLPTVGELMYTRLTEALHELGAEGVWVREFADDTPVLAFLLSKGLEERYRYRVTDVGDLVVLKRELRARSGLVNPSPAA